MNHNSLRLAKISIAVLGLAFFAAACQGHYSPRNHIDDIPPKPGHVKTKYYH